MGLFSRRKQSADTNIDEPLTPDEEYILSLTVPQNIFVPSQSQGQSQSPCGKPSDWLQSSRDKQNALSDHASWTTKGIFGNVGCNNISSTWKLSEDHWRAVIPRRNSKDSMESGKESKRFVPESETISSEPLSVVDSGLAFRKLRVYQQQPLISPTLHGTWAESKQICDTLESETTAKSHLDPNIAYPSEATPCR